MTTKSKTPQIRFKGFSGEWEEKKFEDVISDLYNGQTPSRIVESYWYGKINWLSSGELNRSIVTKTIEKISVSGQKNANLRIVPSGTFVMAITGLEATGTRGNCAILGIDTTLNQSCMAIYPNLNLLSTHFLFQWYRKYSEEYGIKFTQGTKQQSYNAAIIRKLDITLPKVAEQTKIGDYFQHLDKLIEQKEKKYQKLHQFKKAMLDKMFPKNGAATPKIRFKGFSGEWEEKELGDITTSFSGGTPTSTNKSYYSGNIPFVGSGKINSDSVEQYITIEALENSSAKMVDKGDLLYALYGATSGEVGISKIKGAINQAVLCLRTNENKYFLFKWLQNNKTIILSTYLQGGQGNLSAKIIKDLKLYLPIQDEQTKIGNYFQYLDKLINLHQTELQKLKNIKKASLEKMFV